MTEDETNGGFDMEAIKAMLQKINERSPDTELEIHQTDLSEDHTYVATGFQITTALAVNMTDPNETFNTVALVFTTSGVTDGRADPDKPTQHVVIVVPPEGLQDIAEKTISRVLCPSLVDDMNLIIDAHHCDQCEDAEQ